MTANPSFPSRRHALGFLVAAAKDISARPSTPAELRAAVAADIPYWGGIAKRVGARND